MGGETSFPTGFTFMDVPADIPADTPVELSTESPVTPEIEPQERPVFDLEGHFGAIESEFELQEAKALETTVVNECLTFVISKFNLYISV